MCVNNTTGTEDCLPGSALVPPGSQCWFWVGLDTVLFVVILLGNLFTVYILRSSRVMSNRFVISLAMTDTLVGLTLPYHMAFTVFPQLSINKTTCILRFVFVLMACCCSILNVTAIAFDRYLAILHPFKYETLVTKRVVRRVLVIAGLNALILSTVPIYWNTWEEAQHCELGQVLPRYYMIAVLTPAFLIIWTAMIAIYSRIWHEAVIQAEKLRRTNVSHQCKPSFQVVLLVMGCFTICWLPFLAVACTQAAGYRDLISSTVYKAVLCLALSSSALNPLIYAWKNAEFKEAVRAIIKCSTKDQAHLVTGSPQNNLVHPQTSV